MPTYVSGSGGGADYATCPEGQYIAVCCDVTDLGLKEVFWQGKSKKVHKLRLTWQVNKTHTYEDQDTGEDVTRPHTVIKQYTASINKKANLHKDIVAWRSRDFTKEELVKWDADCLIGECCQLGIKHRESADGSKTYANIMSISPLMEGMEELKVSEGFIRYQDRERKEDETEDD